jgi:hypothetical protein
LPAAAVLAAIPLSGQLHLALGAVPLFAAYAWARLPATRWARAASGAVAVAVLGAVVQRVTVDGSIAEGGRSIAQVERYSAEVSDFVTRGVGAGIEEFVFLGWLTPAVAAVGLATLARRQRRLAWVLGAAAILPALLALGTNLPLYEHLWRELSPLRYARVPERLMPIACLALAALVAVALTRVRHGALVAAALVALAVDVHVPVFGAVRPDATSPAYAAIQGAGRLVELPVIRPDIHFGSVYLGYARQSPRERPQGYSTTAPRAADRWARRNRSLSCGAGLVEEGVRFVAVHRGVYRQSSFFAASCRTRAEESLSAQGFGQIARDGPIVVYERRFRR